jgi:demethylmenaquinone methyltransferase/2-methoxy-6-polyprenyl-1,4-benzoquinol methylase
MTPASPSSSGPAWAASDLSGSPHEKQDKADRVQSMFEAVAGSYDRNNRVHSFGRDQVWRRRAVELAAVRRTDRVLDVACGTGDLTEALAAAGPAEVVGGDFTPAMLDLARQKAERRRRRPGVPQPTYVAADAMNLPFEDGAFDIVTIAFGIRNVADPTRALEEFHRVLGRGGRLVILEFSEPTIPILRGLSRFYTHQVMPRTATWIARDRSGAYRYLPRSIETFLDRESMANAMMKAGFDAIQQVAMTFGVCVAYRGVRT